MAVQTPAGAGAHFDLPIGRSPTNRPTRVLLGTKGDQEDRHRPTTLCNSGAVAVALPGTEPAVHIAEGCSHTWYAVALGSFSGAVVSLWSRLWGVLPIGC